MSGGLEVLKCQESDVAKMLAAAVHLGTPNSEITMQHYVYKRRSDGVHIINLKKTWEKLMLAARAIAAVENPEDVFVVSSRPFGQRAVLKFARYIGATAIAGRFTPGAFTNQIQAAFREPRLLVVADPRADHQPVKEGSYANIPIIAFCNSDSPTRYIDIVVPCNNKAVHPIGLMWWFLAREVLHLRGAISRDFAWEVMPDLFFYRDPEEAEKEEQARQESLMQAQASAAAAAAAQTKPEEDWGNDQVTDWANEPAPGGIVPAAAVAGGPAAAPVAGAVPAAAPVKFQVTEDWASSGVQSDWAADNSSGQMGGQQWGGSSNWN